MASLCILGHIHAMDVPFFASISARFAPLLSALHSTKTHALLSVITFLGPGREILVDGLSKLVNVKAIQALFAPQDVLGAPSQPQPPVPVSSNPNMNTLVALGAVSSFAMSVVAVLCPHLGWPLYFEEPTMLFAFVLFGRAMETRAKLMASSDLTSLIELMPRTARRLSRPFENIKSGASDVNRSGNVGSGFSIGSFGNFVGIGNDENIVPCSELSKGDSIIVTPGDIVPVDGVVVNGKTSVNESSVNGEAMPVVKGVGDEVLAGTVNIDGVVVIGVQSAGKDTQLAEVVRMTEEASQRTPNVQRIADLVSGRFVQGVMATSALTFVFWRTVGAKLLAESLVAATASPIALSLQFAASVLVVACPCALGLATPTAVLVGSSIAARRGLLIRGGDVLETISQVNTIIFDKTGTLTVGEPRVERVIMRGEGSDGAANISGYDSKEMMRLAAAVESGSSHPLAKAIVRAATGADVDEKEPASVAEETVSMTSYDEEEGMSPEQMRSGVIVRNRDGGVNVASAGNGSPALGGILSGVSRTPMGFGIGGGGAGGGGSSGGGAVSPNLRRLVNLPPMQSGSFQQEPGLGAKGTVNGRTVIVGSYDWLVENGIANVNREELPQPVDASKASDGSGGDQDRISSSSVVHVGVAGSVGYIGSVVIADKVRPDAARLIAKLRRRGIESYIFSGDDSVNVVNVARQLGIPETNAIGDMKPRDKAEAIARMRNAGRRYNTGDDARAGRRSREGRRNIDKLQNYQDLRKEDNARYTSGVGQRTRGDKVIAMVGDGINDITALAMADVSIAVGTAADAAADVSGVVLRGGKGKLMQVDEAIDIGKMTMRKVRTREPIYIYRFIFTFHCNTCAGCREKQTTLERRKVGGERISMHKKKHALSPCASRDSYRLSAACPCPYNVLTSCSFLTDFIVRPQPASL